MATSSAAVTSKSNTSTSTRSGADAKALTLLGSGYSAEVVASSVGLSVSRISQLLSDEEFAAEVTELRFKNLQKHNARDDAYDSMEEKLQKQLDSNLSMIMRPMEIVRALSVLNAMKRRGHSTPEGITGQQTVVKIVMPKQITQRFITNGSNQVTQAGSQELLTLQSGAMKSLSSARESALEVTVTTGGPNNGVNYDDL